MSERKNLEHLFQEKLQHFEVAPPEELWDNIELELKKEKKKRRVIPFWWKLSGVAALLVIGFSIFTTVSDNESKNSINTNSTNSVVDTQTDADNLKSTHPTNTSDNSVGTIENKSINSENNQSNSGVADVNHSGEKTNSGKKNTNISSTNSVHSEKNTTNNSVEPENKIKAVAAHSNNIKTKNQRRNKIVNNNESVADVTNYKSTKNNTNNTKENVGNSIENKSNPQNNQVTLMNENNGQDDKIAMKNHTDVVQPKGDIIKKTDSASVANAEPNAMEELLNEKEKESTQKQKINRWQVTPNLAPIYFGSFTEGGSPLDEMLAENDKVYNTSMSYGVAVNYAVNKKLKVRTGINVLSVDYDTQGIVFYQDTNAKTMKNIDPTQLGSMIQIRPLSYVEVEIQLDKVISERFDGVLNQKMGYIEMPVEMSYKIVDKKFGVELVGGFSTLFLNTNEIFLKTADGLNMKIGKATNLNDIHFSSNFGIGLNYKLFKNFDARIEPTFKYQLNTFSTSSGEFKPYIFGVYSGISYRF